MFNVAHYCPYSQTAKSVGNRTQPPVGAYEQVTKQNRTPSLLIKLLVLSQVLSNLPVLSEFGIQEVFASRQHCTASNPRR